ncbi:MAG: MFS transporter [Candidatus Krumholzibacteriia bacterium]
MAAGSPDGRRVVPAGYFASAAFMDGGFFLIMTAMPFRVLDLGGGALALGLTAATGAVAYIVAAPLAGRLADRAARRPLAALGAASLVACALLAWWIRRLDLLVALQVLMGLGKALYWPPAQAAVGDLTPAADRSRVLGRYNLAWSGGKGLGFVAGGLLLARAGFEATYLAGAACVVAAAMSLPRRGARPAEDAAPDGAAIVTSDLPPGFLAMSWVANTAAYSAFGILTYHLPQYLGHRGWQADQYGWFLGAILASQTLVFLWLGLRRRQVWSRRGLWWPQAGALLAMALLPLWNDTWPLLLTAPLLGLGCGVCYQASITASLADPVVRGRRAGIHEGLIGAGGFAAPLLAGVLVRLGLPLAAPYLLGAACLAAALAAQAVIGRRRGRSVT